ncbi:MAG: guanylate kinase [Gammaproteobacteria bacterium]|nr:guanylate kinase [Gammaproteobacteria bacterium]
MADRGHLFVVAAPSGAGKTSLLRALLARRPGLEFSVSCTTRAPRPQEQTGRDYHFVGREEFQRLVDSDGFIEHAEVFGNRYGTPRRQVEAALAAGLDLVLEIDWQGARQVRQRLPEAVQIFILPPSRAELAQRLRGRGTDSPEVIARRLSESVADLSHWAEFDYVVVNRDFATAVGELESIVAGRGEASRRDRPGLEAFVTELLQTAG